MTTPTCIQAAVPSPVAPARISVIIPARNEERVIARCLDALTAIDYPREAFEVIVVDNASFDRTVQVARSFADRLDIRILELPNVHISALRNAGAAAAQGDVLAFLDADCIPGPDWLRRVRALLTTEGAGVVGAFYTIPPDSTWVGKAWCGGEHLEKSGPVSYVPGGTLFIRRDDFDVIGGFDATIQTNEDYEFCQRVRAAGMPVLARPDLSVVHLGTPRTLATFYRKQKWHGRNVFTVFLRDIKRLPNARAVVFSLWTLASLAAIAAGAVLAAGAQHFALLAAGLAGLLAGPILLASRRTLAQREPGLLPALILLYLTYGIARAVCLLHSDTLRRQDRSEAK